MKKLLAALSVCVFSGIVSAADPAFQGNFFIALNETDAQQRAVKLVDALEASANATGKVDNNVLGFIKIEFENNNPAFQQLLPRLFVLLDKHPGNFLLAKICFDGAKKYELLTPELFSGFEKCLSATNISELSGEQRDAMLEMLFLTINYLISENASERAIKLLDTIIAANPNDLKLLAIEAEAVVRACFFDSNTAPGLNGFEELAADNKWKVRLQAIAEKLLALQISNAENAELQLKAAIMLNLSQAPELLRQYSARFTGHDWSLVSAEIADKFNNPELFIPGENPIINFLLACHAKNFDAAERCIAQIGGVNENVRRTMNILLLSAKNDHSQVLRLAGEAELTSFSEFSLMAIINSAHLQKDAAIITRLLPIIEQLKNSGDEFENYSLCNSIGYCAADLNIELARAEALIRFAVENDPENPSYLDSLAWVLFRQGKLEEAEAMIDRALKFRVPEAAISVLYLHAAEIKAARNKLDEARSMLNNAKLLYDPDDPDCSEYNLQSERRLERILK